MKKEEGESLAQLYFGHLSDHDFVEMCKEILEKKGLTDLEILEGPGDRGNDIIGDEILKTKLGDEKRRCLIQCKHYAKSGRNVSDEEVRTARGSMSQRSCKSVLIITSTTLTSPAKHTLRQFREVENIPFYYWDGKQLAETLKNKNFREIGMKFNIGRTLLGAIIRNIRELHMNLGVFHGAEAKPVKIDFKKFAAEALDNNIKIDRLFVFTFKLTGLTNALNVRISQYGGTDYIQDKFWQKYGSFLFRKERLLAKDLLNRYVAEQYEKRGRPKPFPIDLLEQGDILELLTEPPLLEALYGISWEISSGTEVNESLREVKEAFCKFVSKYLSENEKDAEWFVVLSSNPVTSCYVENTSKLRASMVVLPQYKNFFDLKPTDNDWIGLPNGVADEKSKWLFGLAPSFSEYGSISSLTKINPQMEIEGYISITPMKGIRDFHFGPVTFGDLANIPDLRARWFFNDIFYLRPEKIEDEHFINSVFNELEKERKNETIESINETNFMMSKVDVRVPDNLQETVSDFVVYAGSDPWSVDRKFGDYCRNRGLLNYDIRGSVFLMLVLSFRTKSLEPSYVISKELVKEADKFAQIIEEGISKSLKSEFKRLTLERRKIYYDYRNNRQRS